MRRHGNYKLTAVLTALLITELWAVPSSLRWGLIAGKGSRDWKDRFIARVVECRTLSFSFLSIPSFPNMRQLRHALPACSWHAFQSDHGRRKQRGTGGRVPRSRKISLGRHPPPPPEIMIFQYLFSRHTCKFCIFHHFQNKVAEIRGET